MTTVQFEQALGQSTSTDKVLSLCLSKQSNENQRNTLRPNKIHCSIITISLSIHGHFAKPLSSATLRLTRTHYQHGQPPIFRSRRYPWN